MKKFICVYLLIFSLMLSGCNTTLCNNQDYKIFEEDGKWFIQFHKNYRPYKWKGGLYEVCLPDFNTAAEMKDAISNGNAPYSSMLDLHEQAGTKPFEIIDPTQWYELSLPQHRSLHYITWCGDQIGYHINDYDSEKDNPAGYQYYAYEAMPILIILKKEQYEEKLQKAFPDMDKNDYSLKSYEKISYRNATKCVYNKGINQPDYYTVFRYEYETPEGIRYVSEEFDSDKSGNSHENGTELMAPGNPRRVDVYWTDGFGYFWLKVTTNIPVTDEWLQAFQMTPITD